MPKAPFNRKAVDPALADQLGRELLSMVAAGNFDDAKIRKLVDDGANLEVINDKQQTALHIAAMRGHVTTVQTLIDGGANLYAENQDKATPLFLAIAIAHRPTVKTLLDAGVDPDKGQFRGNLTGLMWAANLGKDEIIEELVAHGAKVNRREDTSKGKATAAIDFAEHQRTQKLLERLGQQQEAAEARRIEMEAHQKQLAEHAEMQQAIKQNVENHAELDAPAKARFTRKKPVPQV